MFFERIDGDMDVSFYIDSFSLDPMGEQIQFSSFGNSSYDSSIGSSSSSDYSDSSDYLFEVLSPVKDCLGL